MKWSFILVVTTFCFDCMYRWSHWCWEQYALVVLCYFGFKI